MKGFVRSQPMRPEKIFGLIVFERRYNKVRRQYGEALEREYAKSRARFLMNLKASTP